MKLLINRYPVQGPWGGGNLFVESCYDMLPSHGFDLVQEFENDIDAILVCDPRPRPPQNISINEVVKYKNYNPNVKVFLRINENDARKNTNEMDEILRFTSAHIDHSIFISDWLEGYHREKGWHCKDSSVIYSGVSSNFGQFKKTKSEKTRIVTHHWSNNRMKGFDIYEAIDDWVSNRDDFTFTYIGRECGTFKNTKIVDPLSGKELAKALSDHDVYVTGTRHEPMGNHVLEAIASNLPTYSHVDGGGAAELAGKDNLYNSWDDLKKILITKQFKNNTLRLLSWDECIKEFADVIKNTVNSKETK